MNNDVEIIVPPAEAATDPAAFMRWDEAFWNEPAGFMAERVKADILIESEITILEGHYEAGKTAIMTDVERRWIEMGHPVLHLDYEMGKRRIRDRIRVDHPRRGLLMRGTTEPDGKNEGCRNYAEPAE